MLPAALLMQLDREKPNPRWVDQINLRQKYIPTSLLEILWFCESCRGICKASTQPWTCRPLWTVYSHVEISCHWLSSVFMKNAIYAVCRGTENCFWGISPLQFEANDSKLVCSKLTWHYNRQIVQTICFCKSSLFVCPSAGESSVYTTAAVIATQQNWEMHTSIRCIRLFPVLSLARHSPKGTEKPFLPL